MTKLSARLIALTQPVVELQEGTPEGVLTYCARVSNPQQQDKPLGSLLDYCIRNKKINTDATEGQLKNKLNELKTILSEVKLDQT